MVMVAYITKEEVMVVMVMTHNKGGSGGGYGCIHNKGGSDGGYGYDT